MRLTPAMSSSESRFGGVADGVGSPSAIGSTPARRWPFPCVRPSRFVVELRAERSGGSKSGRVYQLTVTAQDLAGNGVTGTATCTVPHDRGEGK